MKDKKTEELLKTLKQIVETIEYRDYDDEDSDAINLSIFRDELKKWKRVLKKHA